MDAHVGIRYNPLCGCRFNAGSVKRTVSHLRVVFGTSDCLGVGNLPGEIAILASLRFQSEAIYHADEGIAILLAHSPS